MKKKGILSIVLIMCLILSTISVPAFGADEDSKNLEQAILATKKIVTIPDSYSDFTHSSSERQVNGSKVTVWNLNWSEKEDNKGSISISIGENGFLYSYNKYDNDDQAENGLAKITKDEAQSSAENFLKRAVPQYNGSLKKIENNSNYFSNREYYFTYQKFLNEVPVDFIIINVGVNKYTGEVTSYSDNNPEIKGTIYPALDGIISPDVAEKNYIDKSGVDLKYYSYYDYEQKKINIFVGYSPNNTSNLIDAKTGQVVSYFNENQIYPLIKDSIGASNSVNNLARDEQKLSDAEIDAINKIANLITKEKAESILRETSDLITKYMKVNDVSLNKNYFNDGYTWDVSFDGAYGSVDAKSGEILSLHCYNYNNETSKNISKADAQNIAESFLQKVSPVKFAQTKYKDMENPVSKIDVVQEGNSFSFNFVRQVNGIEFSGNSLNVEVDKAKGKVIGYYNNWYDNISFPDVSQAISKEAAFNKIKDLAGFSMQYAMIDKNKIGLVYGFMDMNNSYIIDPISGTRIDFTGKVYIENKLPDYKDIAGHWSEKTVKELLDNGYYIDGEKFNPDMNITQINFFKYLYSPTKSSYSDDEFYNMLIQNGIIKKEEKAPSSLVSYSDVAKFVIRYLGYDKLAAHSEIFNVPFKDNIEEEYKGYATMCYALNIIKGDENGNFNGTHNISNSEAAVIIYNLIKNNTK